MVTVVPWGTAVPGGGDCCQTEPEWTGPAWLGGSASCSTTFGTRLAARRSPTASSWVRPITLGTNVPAGVGAAGEPAETSIVALVPPDTTTPGAGACART